MTQLAHQNIRDPHWPLIEACLTPLAGHDTLRLKWLELEQRSDCSFFQSWTWIGTWLAASPSTSKRYLLEVTEAGRTMGLAVLGSMTSTRHGFVHSRALLLHETGSHDVDRVTIEHNSLLAEAGREPEVIAAGLRCITAAGFEWDELLASGVNERVFEAWKAPIAESRCRLVYRQQSSCPFVDLDVVRKRGGDYLAVLSPNTRQQIRRSVKAYEKSGRLSLSVAASGEAAVEYLHELQGLHDSHWNGKGKEGAFPNSFTRTFHDKLARDGGDSGSVQMLKISAGDEVVGYLYNFVRGGHVYFYQSGVKYSDDQKLKPGLVCHYLAVMHNLQVGNRIYDFLAGPQRYKQSLATAQAQMFWISLQRPRLMFAAERLLNRVKDVLREKLRPPVAT